MHLDILPRYMTPHCCFFPLFFKKFETGPFFWCFSGPKTITKECVHTESTTDVAWLPWGRMPHQTSRRFSLPISAHELQAHMAGFVCFLKNKQTLLSSLFPSHILWALQENLPEHRDFWPTRNTYWCFTYRVRMESAEVAFVVDR